MYVVEVSDRGMFREKARESNTTINVLRFPTVKPVRAGNTVTMKPAVVLNYFFDADGQQWTYSETRYADSNKRASLENTLLEDIEKSGISYRLVHRSGSF